MPTKGQLITMDLGGTYKEGFANPYIVLKTEGNTALVMAMFDASTSQKYWTKTPQQQMQMEKL